MKERIAIGLGLASLLISGLTLFSVLGHADEGPVQTFTVLSPGQQGTAEVQGHVQVVYASLLVTVNGSTVPGHSEVREFMIFLREPHIAEAAAKDLAAKQNYVFLYRPDNLSLARFGTGDGNAHIDSKGRMHIDARDVLMVSSTGEKSNLLAAADPRFRSAGEDFLAEMKAVWDETLASFRATQTAPHSVLQK